MIVIFIFTGLWLLCAVLTASILLGYFQNKYPDIAKEYYQEDLYTCWLSSLLGPFSLLMSLSFTNFCRYGMMNPFDLNKYKD